MMPTNMEFQRVMPADLKRMCLSAGLPFPEEEIDRLIYTCPKDDDDKVSFEDFIIHLERSQMEAMNAPLDEQITVPPVPEPSDLEQLAAQGQADAAFADYNDYMDQAATFQNNDNSKDPMQLQQENEELKANINALMQKLNMTSGTPGPTNPMAVLPDIPAEPSTASTTVRRVTRSNNQNKGISNVFPDISREALPEIQVKGRRKFKVVDPPTEDIFGNNIQINAPPASNMPIQDDGHGQRPKPDIDAPLLDNIRACMDRNNKRALKDVNFTIDRWNGGTTMTKRMLTKIIKHSGLRLPNETVRVLFDKLDVYADGTVAVSDFLTVFKDAETSQPKTSGDPAQISRNRRAEMQNRAAPWATM